MARSRRTGSDGSSEPSLSPASAAILEPWQDVSPVLQGPRVTLRELRASDAVPLLAAVSTTDVARFISPPPDTAAGFERFIADARRQRALGEAICFGVLTAGYSSPVGLVHVRRTEPRFAVAEWGFALGGEFWGEGLFHAAAPLVLDWVFATLGAARLECRSATTNGRVNGALRQLGAVQEAVLPRSQHRDGEYLDQLLWTLTAEGWLAMHPGARQVH